MYFSITNESWSSFLGVEPVDGHLLFAEDRLGAEDVAGVILYLVVMEVIDYVTGPVVGVGESRGEGDTKPEIGDMSQKIENMIPGVRNVTIDQGHHLVKHITKRVKALYEEKMSRVTTMTEI